jgi:hypothetical protein
LEIRKYGQILVVVPIVRWKAVQKCKMPSSQCDNEREVGSDEDPCDHFM